MLCYYQPACAPVPFTAFVREVFAVSSVLDHPSYDGDYTKHDISIMTLARPITYSAVAAPVCLPASVSPLYTGELASVAGWGDTTQGGSGSPTLIEVNLTVTSNSQCSNAYEADGWYGIDTIDRLVCLTLDLDLH